MALIGTRRRYERVNRAYQGWLRCPPRPDEAASYGPSDGPLLSVVMPVYNTAATLLEEAIESVLAQTYPHWELCIADDASTAPHVRETLGRYADQDRRIRVLYREQAGHIARASNSAIALARGAFIVLLDHDDCLTPDALGAVARVIAAEPAVDLIYSDEDKLDPAGRRIEPFFKPAWSPALLLSCNYVTHLAALRRALVLEVGGFRHETVGSQDHDLFLRVGERARAVAHIPRVLYSWRMAPGSTAAASSAKPYAVAAARRALEDAVERRGLPAEIAPSHLNGLFILRHRAPRPARVSLIVQGGAGEWRALLRSPDLEVCDIAFLPGAGAAGFDRGPRAVPIRATIAELTGEYLIWIDSRCRPAAPDAAASLLEHLQYEQVGIVGGLTTDRHGTVLQAGLTIGDAGQPYYTATGLPALPQHNFFLNLKDLVREVAAVPHLCCALRRSTWREVGGERADLPPALAVCDLSLRALGRGYSNIYTPRARFIRKGRPAPVPSVAGFDWPWRAFVDPFANPNLSPGSGDGLPFRRPAFPRPRLRRGGHPEATRQP